MKDLKHALECLATHVEATRPDAKGHVFVCRACGGCDQDTFCNRVMAMLEDELNGRLLLARFLKR